MIRTFRHKGLRSLFETGELSDVSAEMSRKLLRQLDFLNRAASPGDLDLPGYRLYVLKGEREGTWSVRVSGNCVLTLTFRGGDASDVDLEDCH